MPVDEDEDLCSHRNTNETAGPRAEQMEICNQVRQQAAHSLGYFEGEEDAGILYDRAARAHYGVKAQLNLILVPGCSPYAPALSRGLRLHMTRAQEMWEGRGRFKKVGRR
jgi:hypothetical protein